MSNFDKAFRAARTSGKKVFSFGGKSYNTKLKSSSPKAKVPVPANKPAPKAAVASNPDLKKDDAVAKATPKSPAVGIAKAGSPIANAAERYAKAKASAAAKVASKAAVASSAVAKGTSEGPTKAEAKGAADRAKVRALLKKKTA